MSDEVRVNGRLADGSITIKLRGKEYYGFTEITYGDGVEVTNQEVRPDGGSQEPRLRELLR